MSERSVAASTVFPGGGYIGGFIDIRLIAVGAVTSYGLVEHRFVRNEDCLLGSAAIVQPVIGAPSGDALTHGMGPEA